MHKQLPGFDELPMSTKKKHIKPFDPTYAGETKARGPHTCDFCGRAILPGEIYYQEGKEKFLGTLDGRRMCSRCYADLAAAKQSRSPR